MLILEFRIVISLIILFVMLASPCLDWDIQSYLHQANFQPVLLYGSESMHVNTKHIQKMETCQGNIIMKYLGLSKYSRSTTLLHALNISKLIILDLLLGTHCGILCLK